ncbi:hypothetical protein NDU88_010945 [Pleurodeles waltl]|uniref:Uncharacterized protein n=1 Tax=Pleurodeles waltl TaxID=8319 RepID=A0AAV7S2J5_PLEWA|nr:hypothetical protein NDU88_010945 [Pleurodeles waltl]
MPSAHVVVRHVAASRERVKQYASATFKKNKQRKNPVTLFAAEEKRQCSDRRRTSHLPSRSVTMSPAARSKISAEVLNAEDKPSIQNK